MERAFGNRNITLYPSGTAALARAISDCAARARAANPEAILPSYGCPDLVAACFHARVHPRLVEMAESCWSYDLDSLHSALSRNTVAIIAVNLLGIGDGSADLAPICAARSIPLIQDSAQYLPRNSIDWPGDYVILSFGRGKPLNLLHGGALVGPTGGEHKNSAVTPQYPTRDRLLAMRAAGLVFNVITLPYFYRILSMLPGLGLGEARYRPLCSALPVPEQTWEQVGLAFETYCESPSYQRHMWNSSIAEWSKLGITELTQPASPPQPEPLRLPLLAPDFASREGILRLLNRHHLGASRLYGTDLTRIEGIPASVQRQGPFPKAANLAGRLFTLPTHGLITATTIELARAAFLSWYRCRFPS